MKPIVDYDLEIYENYFLAYFLHEDGSEKTFEIFNDMYDFYIDDFHEYIKSYTLRGFNNANFDDPLSKLLVTGGRGYGRINPALEDASLNKIIKSEANKIIEKQMKGWQFTGLHNLTVKDLTSIDIMDICPGKASLKLYGARIGCKKLQELPIDPHAILTDEQAGVIKKYCRNDLAVTRQLAEELTEPLKLRQMMSETYDVNLMSKSNAQIAEAVMAAKYKDLTGKTLKKPNRASMPKFYKYNAPKWIKFNSPTLNTLFEKIKAAEFHIDEDGKVVSPDCFHNIVSYGNMNYELGVGGMHSKNGSGYYHSTDDAVVCEQDATSFYPFIMLNAEFFPQHIGEVFLKILEVIVTDRVNAKREVAKLYKLLEDSPGDQELQAELSTQINITESLKIVINSMFGKFGSSFSKLFAPDLMFHTTITGQLTLMMLVERFEDNGIPVISANTDGIVTLCPKDKQELKLQLVEEWEAETGFNMEYTDYKWLFMQNVNNYMAVPTAGKMKTKGQAFAKSGLERNPTGDIIKFAAIDFLTENISVEETIRGHKKIQDFIIVKTVAGGAQKDRTPLGKAIRWYISTSTNTAIHYIESKPNKKGEYKIGDDGEIIGNMVGKSQNGKPIMDIPDDFPDDINYDWYIQQANDLVESVNTKCVVGNNRQAEKLRSLNYYPCFISHKGKTVPEIGSDFSRDERLGTQTGHRAGVISVDGLLYTCNNIALPEAYKTITKATDVEIIYGGVVELPEDLKPLEPVPQWALSLIWDYCSKPQRKKLDLFNKGLLI